MGITPEIAAWLANIRREAAHPDFLCHTVQSRKHGSIALFKCDIDATANDQELIELIRRRCGE